MRRSARIVPPQPKLFVEMNFARWKAVSRADAGAVVRFSGAPLSDTGLRAERISEAPA